MRSFCLFFFLYLVCLLFSSDLLQAKPSLPDEDLYKKIDGFIEDARKKWDIPGVAVAIIKNGKVAYTKGYGYRDLASKKPVTAETLFQIGSISKSFAATLSGMLIQENILKWETPVQQFFPEFLLHDEWPSKNFLLEDLLAQRSGLPEKTGDMQTLLGFSIDEIIHNLRFIPPKHSFRLRYAYQNILYLIAAKVLEKATKKSYTHLLQEKICAPLNMKNTIWHFHDYLKKENRASFYIYKNGSAFHIPDNSPLLARSDDYIPAGGIDSNVIDIAKWLEFHIAEGKVGDKQLLAKKYLRKIRRPQIYTGTVGKKATYYGLGWIYSQSSPHAIIWHNGETFGSKTIAAFVPEEKLGIVILTNMRGTNAPEAITWDFMDAYFGKKPRDWIRYFHKKDAPQKKSAAASAPPSTPVQLSDYTGSYKHEILGQARVLAEKDHLVVYLGPNSSKLYLYPNHRDQFTVKWPAIGVKENAIHFYRDKDGKVQNFCFNLFFEKNVACFTRFSDDAPSFFGYL